MISFFFLETAYSSIKRNSKLCSSSVGVPRRPQLQRYLLVQFWYFPFDFRISSEVLSFLVSSKCKRRRGRECTTVGSNGGRA
jgi:hypothetical protein